DAIQNARDRADGLARRVADASDSMTENKASAIVLRGIISDIGKGILKNITDPIVVWTFLFKQIIEAFKLVDNLSANMAKNFGVSYTQSLKLTSEMTKMAADSGQL